MNLNAIGNGRPAKVPSEPPWADAPTLDETIVNIAGVVPGDRVLLTGHTGGAIAATIAAAGGVVVEAAAFNWRQKPPKRFNVVLLTQTSPGLTLPLLRHWLQPGGRLVTWQFIGRGKDTEASRRRLRENLHAAMLTSIIIGRLPAESGEAIVATGVFNPRSNRVKEAAHAYSIR